MKKAKHKPHKPKPKAKPLPLDQQVQKIPVFAKSHPFEPFGRGKR